MKKNHFFDQRGIALGPILFIIAILAILAAAIAAGAGGFSGTTTNDQAKVYSSALIDYADQVKTAVDLVMSNGCDDTQVSFDNPITSTSYVNSNAPSDHSCHVFDPRGGSALYKTIPKEIYYDDTYGNWQFVSGVTSLSLTGYGSANNDLWLIAEGNINSTSAINTKGQALLKACLEVNSRMGVAGDGTTLTGLPQLVSNAPFFTKFTGTYAACSTTSKPSQLANQTTFCVESPSTGLFYFARLLIAR